MQVGAKSEAEFDEMKNDVLGKAGLVLRIWSLAGYLRGLHVAGQRLNSTWGLDEIDPHSPLYFPLYKKWMNLDKKEIFQAETVAIFGYGGNTLEKLVRVLICRPHEGQIIWWNHWLTEHTFVQWPQDEPEGGGQGEGGQNEQA